MPTAWQAMRLIWDEWTGQAEIDRAHTEINRLLNSNRSLRAELDARDKQLSVVRGELSRQCADNKALRWKLDGFEGKHEWTA